jgi:hypothetical protein
MRAEAYVAAKRGEAGSEFQKILDHPGLAQNEPIAALARLGLARAYAASKDTSQARAAYQSFLAMWKNADAELPILKRANLEYANLP